MRKIKLFIASSLDGYIARKNGDIDWLFTDNDYGYKEFYAGIDTTLMGNRTYEQVLTFGEFPFMDRKNFVFTRRPDREQKPHVEFITGDIVEFSRKLKEQQGKDIWLIGGAEIIEVLQKERLIDEYIISVHPLILGSGIPLFKGECGQIDLELISTKDYQNKLVQLHYRVKA